MTVVHPRDDPLEDSPGLWFRTLSSLHWRIWGGDTLHHHGEYVGLSTRHYTGFHTGGGGGGGGEPGKSPPPPKILATILINTCRYNKNISDCWLQIYMSV